MALSGMTGFGRAEGAHGDWSWSVEARSVNGRNLDVRFRGPPSFDSLDRLAREGAQQRFQRGQVTVGIQAKRVEGAAAIQINIEQLERYIAAGSAYVATGLAAQPRMDGLLALRGVIEAADASVGASQASLGDVQVFDVDAVVMPTQMPHVLLGNSFLGRFQMRRDNDTLLLEKRP